MTETLAPNRKKIIDWNKKNDSDAARISKRLEGRNELNDRATTVNDTTSARQISTKPAAPRTISVAGKPLQRLRQKIKEVYDEDEEEDENGTSFFNISLLDEDETENDNRTAGNVLPPARNETEILRITREQQLAGKLNAILSTSMAAKEAGLSPHASAADARLANSAEYDVKKIRRKTLKQKISEPLGLKGNLPEKELTQALRGIKNTKETLDSSSLSSAPLASLRMETSGILNDLPAEAASELAKEDNKKTLAKLILKKSGRNAPRKKLSEIAKGEESFKKNEQAISNGREDG